MEDKKRALDSVVVGVNGGEPQRKKPLVGPTSTPDSKEPLGPLTLEDIEQFQKEAIFRQMRAYRREKELLEEESEDLKARYQSLQSAFTTLDDWWVQLMDSLFPGSAHSGLSDENEQLVSCLLVRLSKPDEAGELHPALKTKHDIIHKRINSWLTAHPSGSPEVAGLRDSLAKLSQQLSEVKGENSRLQTARDSLISQVEDVTGKYLTASKRLDRLECPSVARVMPPSGSTDQNEASTEENGTKVKEEVDSAQLKVLTTELDNAKASLASSQAIVDAQKKQLAEYATKVAALNQQIQDLLARLNNLPITDVERSDAFRNLKLHNDDLSTRLHKLTARAESLAQENSKLVVGQNEFESRVRREYEGQRQGLEQQLAKAEQDVARIRSARDDLISELNIKKAGEQERKRAFKELNDLVAIRESRIKTLETELKRLKEEEEKSRETSDVNLDTTAVDDLREMVKKLQRQNKSLSGELPGLEQAFSQAHSKATAKIFDAVEQEALVNKLKAEKVRADEKYFAAMRTKDQLGQENNKLKTQLAKSSEIIQQLRDGDVSKTTQITGLRKQVDEVRQVQQSLEKGAQAARLKTGEREHQLDSAMRMVEKLRDEVRAKDGSVQKEVDSRHALEIEIEKLKRQVEVKRMTSGSGPQAESQMEALRSIAICSLCSKNWKDTAIKVCGHVFCNDCAKDRLNARLRKCPMCNKQYSFNDLLPVHL